MLDAEKKAVIDTVIDKIKNHVRVFEAGFTASSGLVLIEIKYEDFLRELSNANEGAIIVCKNNYIDSEDVEDSGNDDLIGILGSTSWYLRDGETSTWFVFRIEFVDVDLLSQDDDDLDDGDYKHDYGHDFSINKIHYFALQVASLEDFGRLRNKRERLDFARSFVFSQNERDDMDIASTGIANAAENIYDYFVLPNLVKKLSEEGMATKDIAKLTGKSQRKVESSLDVLMPTFVSKMLDSSKIHEKSLQLGQLQVDDNSVVFFAQVLRKEEDKKPSFEHIGDVEAIKIDGNHDVSESFIYQFNIIKEYEGFLILPNDLIYIWIDGQGTVKAAFEVMQVKPTNNQSSMPCQCLCVRRKDLDA